MATYDLLLLLLSRLEVGSTRLDRLRHDLDVVARLSESIANILISFRVTLLVQGNIKKDFAWNLSLCPELDREFDYILEYLTIWQP